jgi:hypothetical protein
MIIVGNPPIASKQVVISPLMKGQCTKAFGKIFVDKGVDVPKQLT